MKDAIYAAECDACEAFAVSTYGADGWDRTNLEELARVHLRNCTGDADRIAVEKKPSPGLESEVVGEVQR